MNWMKHNTSRQIAVAMLYTDCLYRRILKFFKQADECCYFSIVFFNKLANPLCLWISDTETVWFMCIFSVFIDQKCCVQTLECTADSRVQVCAIRVYEPWCWISKKVSKIVFYEMLIMFGINFTTKTELFQGSHTYWEFNTWPLPM